MPQISGITKLTKVTDHTTAGTSAVNSGSVDMANFEGVIFFSSFGTAATGNTIAASQSQDDSSFAALAGTSVTSGSSDEDVWVDIYRPAERYVRADFARGTSSTLESIWALQYGPKKMPVTNSTTGTIVGEAHVAPAEGSI